MVGTAFIEPGLDVGGFLLPDAGLSVVLKICIARIELPAVRFVQLMGFLLEAALELMTSLSTI